MMIAWLFARGRRSATSVQRVCRDLLTYRQTTTDAVQYSRSVDGRDLLRGSLRAD